MTKLPSPIALLGAAVLAILEGADASGTPIPRALERELRKPHDEQDEEADVLLVPPRVEAPMLFAYHRSHSSHRSHYSGSSGRRGGGGGWRGGGYAPAREPAPPPPPPPPRPPRPARVSLVVYPGGTIYVDGRRVGHDTTRVLRLSAGTHQVRVENQFIGTREVTIALDEGQTGTVTVNW